MNLSLSLLANRDFYYLFFRCRSIPIRCTACTQSDNVPLLLMHSTKRDRRQRMEKQKYQNDCLRFGLHSQLSSSLCSHDCSNTRSNGVTFDPILCSYRIVCTNVRQLRLFDLFGRFCFVPDFVITAAVSHIRSIARQTRIDQLYEFCLCRLIPHMKNRQ